MERNKSGVKGEAKVQIIHRRFATTLILMLLVALTAVAQDGIRMRGCRRGMLLEPTPSFRAQETPRHAGGDFYCGDRRQLVILAAFRDRQFEDDDSTTLAKWDKIFNTDNYHEDSFVGSVHDYFYDQSYGQFNLKFDLIRVNLPDSCKKYRSTNVDENSQYMVDDIVDTLQTLDIDWSQYDWNDDGYVNQILIIYAGEGQNAGGNYNTIWPHQWWLSLHLDLSNPEPDKYRSYRTVYDGDREYRIDCYCCMQEMINSGYIQSTFGTICHEYSHCFGLPDFYDGYTKYVGEWDLMDYGNYNGGGFCPPNYSAHERWLMGWVNPVELSANTSVSDMPALCDEPQAYLIRNDGHEDEYYLVENRQQTGWDQDIPGSGLVVFHVDFDESIWTSIEELTNSRNIVRYSIIPANNKSRYSLSNCAGWAYPYAVSYSPSPVYNDSLTNNSAPAATLNKANTDGSKLMNKSLRDIHVKDGLASFRFTIDQTAGIVALEPEGEPLELYRVGPVGILRYPNGVVKKVIKGLH